MIYYIKEVAYTSFFLQFKIKFFLNKIYKKYKKIDEMHNIPYLIYKILTFCYFF